jgi:hypothetical protein
MCPYHKDQRINLKNNKTFSVSKTCRKMCQISLWAGQLGFNSQQRLGLFLLTTMSRLALRPTYPPIQWVLEVYFLGIKQPGQEVDHLPPSDAKVKNVWSYTSTPQIHLHGMVLIKVWIHLYDVLS